MFEMYWCTWRDIAEILSIAMVTYLISSWLERDTEKPLLIYFYIYCLAGFGCYFLQLPALAFMYVLSMPVVGILFFITHQKSLQRSFVMGRTRPVVKNNTSNWLHELIRGSLYALNHNIELLCFIERQDPLESFLNVPCKYNADLTAGLLDVLLCSVKSPETATIWITSQGKLMAMHVEWACDSYEGWISEDIKSLHKWKQDAIVMTARTDALVVRADPSNRLFDVIVSGSIIEHISSSDLFMLLKQKLQKSLIKEQYYENKTKGHYTHENMP